jgi:hypothetical protein
MAELGADSSQPRPDFQWVDVWSPNGAFSGGYYVFSGDFFGKIIGIFQWIC